MKIITLVSLLMWITFVTICLFADVQAFPLYKPDDWDIADAFGAWLFLVFSPIFFTIFLTVKDDDEDEPNK